MSLLKKSKKNLISSLILGSLLIPTVVGAEAIPAEINTESNVTQESQVQEKIEVWEHIQDTEDSTGSRSKRSMKEHDLSRISYNFTFDMRSSVSGKSYLKPDGSSMKFTFFIEKGATSNSLHKDIQVFLYKNGRQVDRRTVNFESGTSDHHYATFRNLDSDASYSFSLSKADDKATFSGSCSVE